jgi:hypothetical protein
MPSLHNVDRFLATHISNSRNAASAFQATGTHPRSGASKQISLSEKDNSVVSTGLIRATASAHQETAQVTSNPVFSFPTVSVSGGQSADSSLRATLKKFFALFLGSAKDSNAMEKNSKIKVARELMNKVLESIDALRFDAESGAFKEIIIGSFNELNVGQKPTFLRRFKNFLDSICKEGGGKENLEKYAAFQIAVNILRICSEELARIIERNAILAAPRSDFPRLPPLSPSDEEVARAFND